MMPLLVQVLPFLTGGDPARGHDVRPISTIAAEVEDWCPNAA
jgi:hypothetical protein